MTCSAIGIGSPANASCGKLNGMPSMCPSSRPPQIRARRADIRGPSPPKACKQSPMRRAAVSSRAGLPVWHPQSRCKFHCSQRPADQSSKEGGAHPAILLESRQPLRGRSETARLPSPPLASAVRHPRTEFCDRAATCRLGSRSDYRKDPAAGRPKRQSSGACLAMRTPRNCYPATKIASHSRLPCPQAAAPRAYRATVPTDGFAHPRLPG